MLTALGEAFDLEEAKALGLLEIDAFKIDVAGLTRWDVDRPPLGADALQRLAVVGDLHD
ncbi:hypothetical protein [Sinorhizobium meliloti]|uniref:hypothetical protein n=1 Tax=Rhizobium meliloti TaxID=382 RepID=UPI001F4500C2|nr:hypothetical protein [Sinorhizobium meliloti]